MLTARNVALVVPVRNGGRVWGDCIRAIQGQSLQPQSILVIDSQSSDDSLALAQAAGFKTHVIAAKDFNHGGTRSMGAAMLPEADIFIFLTQDAVLESPLAFENMVACFEQPDVAAVCGRQLPHTDANPLAHHARIFNYSEQSSFKRASDIPTIGVKAAFMSNSFAAYRATVFREMGGFPNNTILAEDMHLTARLLLAGHTVAYCAQAAVRHSHNYTPLEEFKRYFDTGVFHACEPWIRERFGGAGGEGLRFVRSELGYLWRCAPAWIPRALLNTAAKAIGFKLGLMHQRLPQPVRRALSMHRSYWNNRSK